MDLERRLTTSIKMLRISMESSNVPSGRLEKIAYRISIIGHPLVTISVFVLIYGYLFYDVKTTISAFLLIVFVVIMPITINNYWQAKKGLITNFDVSDRKQRATLYPYLLLLMAVMSGILYYYNYPESMRHGVLFFFFMLLVMSIINLKIKASLHAASSFYICMMIIKVNPIAGIVALPFSVVVAWSRLVLKRHTLPEIIAGSASGILFGLLG